MAFLRFVCRDLLKVYDREREFIDQVAAFIESKALKPKDAERIIIRWYQQHEEQRLRMLYTLEGK